MNISMNAIINKYEIKSNGATISFLNTRTWSTGFKELL